MLDLSNIFNKDMKKAIMSKEKLAEMLRVTPEALKAFEKSYQLHSMNEPISDNLFKVNAKQAASLNPKQDVHGKGKVQIELFDGDILTGFLQKTGAERFRNNPDLYLRRGFYCLTETLESQDCVNFLIFRFSHVQKIKFV